MNIMTEKNCPVCGTGTEKTVCPVCGFLLAKWFAGEKSRRLWELNVTKARSTMLWRMQDICLERHVFTLTGRRAACILPESGTLVMADRRRVYPPEANIRQYCASERNEVRLHADGTVEITGDDEYQQCTLPRMQGIRSIAVAANCVYGVSALGTVCTKGTVAKNLKLSGVQDLSCGYYHVAALLESGKVAIEPRVEVCQNTDVKMVVAEGEDTLLLYHDGRVDVYPSGNLETKGWTNIVAAAVDTAYVVGLSRDGRILLAQRRKNGISDLLDMGRKEAAGWRDIIAVSCCRSGIGAVDREGRLHLTGNIPNRKDIQENWDSDISEPLRVELARLATARTK